MDVLITKTGNDSKEYAVVNGTHYHIDTNIKVLDVLESARLMGTRLEVVYGNRTTGEAWGTATDPISSFGFEGRIGRSMGPVKIPIVLHNRRSNGGEGLLEHCIVRIRTTSGKLVVYQHPTFHFKPE